MNTKPIGVFDSGIGGLTVLRSLMETLPNEDFIYLADSKNAPYGEKTSQQIINLSEKNTKFLLKQSCKIIIVACNTATGSAIDYLRKEYPNISFVGLEPAIKPACLNTLTKNVGVLATEGTFKGRHFTETSHKYQPYINIHTQAGHHLAQKVEENTYTDTEANILLERYLKPMLENNIDHLVLGCTHYPFYLPIIKKILGDSVLILDSGDAVARRTKDLLMTHKLLNTSSSNLPLELYTTGNKEIMEQLSTSYLGLSQQDFVLEKILSL